MARMESFEQSILSSHADQFLVMFVLSVDLSDYHRYHDVWLFVAVLNKYVLRRTYRIALVHSVLPESASHHVIEHAIVWLRIRIEFWRLLLDLVLIFCRFFLFPLLVL